jgi:hypothetical protein
MSSFSLRSISPAHVSLASHCPSCYTASLDRHIRPCKPSGLSITKSETLVITLLADAIGTEYGGIGDATSQPSGSAFPPLCRCSRTWRSRDALGMPAAMHS